RLNSEAGTQERMVAAAPAGVDMGKVAATLAVIDELNRGDMDAAATESALRTIAQQRAVSDTHFAVFAAAGAVALSVIFGVIHAFAVVMIALSAGAGGYLRRWLARRSHNPLLQPFCAALLAGAVASIAMYLLPDEPQRLVAVCPCMVLVPGPHILNGALDLARARIPLGAARIGYAALIVLMICAGLLLGLSFGGVTLPVSGPSVPVPLVFDVLAAGVAVAAYGTFFSMPARMLPLPILVGMLAHGARWAAISVGGANVEVAALFACLIVGVVITPLADRMRVPFAAVAFASVVALIPGVYIFHMAEGFLRLVVAGAATPPEVLAATLADGSTAFLITVAMALGLILPKVCIERFSRR
ncbi:MAG TPA: threonine/serine exporter family protein, partial [Steroidobacteraceae bacterium]